MKIAIIGPEEGKWTKRQKTKAINEIAKLIGFYFWSEKIGSEFIPFQKSDDCKEQILNNKFTPIKGNILISGHCPKGGVDIWVEEIADRLCITKEIYNPETNQWNDKEITYADFSKEGSEPFYKKKILLGYKSRNIQIAEACDILYCIVPYNKLLNLGATTEYYNITSYCIHCKKWEHPTNGGCWTMKYTKEKLSKETHLIAIE